MYNMYEIFKNEQSNCWSFIDSHDALRNYPTYEQCKKVRDSYLRGN